jgi:hypothetical protein
MLFLPVKTIKFIYSTKLGDCRSFVVHFSPSFLLSASEPVNHYVCYAILDGENNIELRQKLGLLTRSCLVSVFAVPRSDYLKAAVSCFQIVFYVTVRGRFSAYCLKWSIQNVELKQTEGVLRNKHGLALIYLLVRMCYRIFVTRLKQGKRSYCTVFRFSQLPSDWSCFVHHFYVEVRVAYSL